jgi:hypothetical protein
VSFVIFLCMDVETILMLLKARLGVVKSNETTLTVDCERWDTGLGLPKGSTAKYIDKAIQGTRFSIALRGNQLIRLAISPAIALCLSV